MTLVKTRIFKNSFEKKAWEQQQLACGLDEVGRGCIAGPLVVAAVILPPNTTYALLKDSKVMTAQEREKAFVWIKEHCQWSYACASNRIIDSRNIYQATLFAMRKAYLQLIETIPYPIEKLKYVLIDAMPLEFDALHGHEGLEFYHFPKGERHSASIAAASIVAKVIRDQLMREMGQSFPPFAFDVHKGYATKLHQDAFAAHGPSIVHRITFTDHWTNIKNDVPEQQSLFTTESLETDGCHE
jgi:ribonuclease HII